MGEEKKADKPQAERPQPQGSSTEAFSGVPDASVMKSMGSKQNEKDDKK